MANRPPACSPGVSVPAIFRGPLTAAAGRTPHCSRRRARGLLGSPVLWSARSVRRRGRAGCAQVLGCRPTQLALAATSPACPPGRRRAHSSTTLRRRATRCSPSNPDTGFPSSVPALEFAPPVRTRGRRPAPSGRNATGEPGSRRCRTGSASNPGRTNTSELKLRRFLPFTPAGLVHGRCANAKNVAQNHLVIDRNIELWYTVTILSKVN